jgi:hypothetical protein
VKKQQKNIIWSVTVVAEKWVRYLLQDTNAKERDFNLVFFIL